VISAFTDPLALCLQIKLEAALLQRGRGLWKMNTNVFEDATSRSRIQQEWTRWTLQEGKYLDMITWWEKYVEPVILFLFIQEGTAKTGKEIINKNFYFASLYTILKNRRHPMEKTPIFNHHKAKIRRLHSKRFQSITKDTHEATLSQGECQSHFHLLQMIRCVSRMNTSAIDNGLLVQTTARRILHTFLESSCKANMILFGWIMLVFLEWRKQGIGPFAWNGGTFKTLQFLK